MTRRPNQRASGDRSEVVTAEDGDVFISKTAGVHSPSPAFVLSRARGFDDKIWPSLAFLQSPFIPQSSPQSSLSTIQLEEPL